MQPIMPDVLANFPEASFSTATGVYTNYPRDATKKTRLDDRGGARDCSGCGRSDYWIRRKGPCRFRVLKAWMPALCTPLNGVTLFGHPAAAAASGEPNHSPTW